MDSKIKHRILGLLVLAGLITISLPLFSSGDDAEKDMQSLKAPPFPDQTIQVSSEDLSEYSTISARAAGSETFEIRDNQMDLTSRSLHPEINHPNLQSDNFVKPHEMLLIDRAAQAKPIKAIKVIHHTIAPAPIAVLTEGRHVINIKDASWAIQMGTFANKANALRMVNHLRSNGYRAFIQSSAHAKAKSHTKVFIGPLNKKMAAVSLASKVEKELHMHGIVVNYKPLNL